ncbi:MAG: DEAD/DEAH box helicase family protein [Slackia sp.]|nr:DEAD/DEAH box helicase family protein [Slackia sp.]
MAVPVTRILANIKQPHGAYLPLSDFDTESHPDDLCVMGDYSIAPSLVGLAVDYGTRIALGGDPWDVFETAIVGAAMVGASDVAESLLAEINAAALVLGEIDEKSIVSLCRLSSFDSAFRAETLAYKSITEINPDRQTTADVGNLILRTKAFFETFVEPVIAGFTFEGAYTDDVGASDGDYICGDTLWDLKVSKKDPTPKNAMQVLLYYLMGLRSNKDEFKAVTRIGLFNPWLQKSWSMSVLDLDESFLSMVENDILGYAPRHARPSVNWTNEGSRTIYEVIDWIRDTCESERDKGDKFERASRYYLMNDPVYAQRFSDVWMWKDAPTNDGADLGIDLVAKDAEDGTYWAIQCKCYQKAMLDLRDVATFYTKANATDDYAHNMIITTCEDFGPNLDKTATQYGTVRLFADSMAESDVDWDAFVEGRAVGKRSFKEPLPHQREAINACLQKFQQHDRGQLIMACGTGKTITSLRLTEEMLPEGSLVLFLAPSISLVAQTMRVWANQSKRDLRCAVVCSDETASSAEGDTWESSLSDIPYPATTDPAALHKQIKRFDRMQGVNVVFSTYQSIQVVSDAQRMGLDPFDLIVCDEAHRTTGASAASEDLTEQSAFTKVHDNRLVSAKKRVYMTATPKIYGDKARVQAKTESYEVSSMDDEKKFGPVFYRLSFGRAVDEGLLTDYRVIALTVSEDVVSEVYQRAMADEEGFEITDAAKVIGCWKGLADQGKKDGSGHPLKNAVAFCSTIPESRRISEYFERTVKAYIDYEREQGNDVPGMECDVRHVDGTMDMANRKDKLAWLADTSEERCHILSNVRCLSEGVDVPNLDAIMFLQPKKSRVEVVQAVGRVMRRFEGKDYGYIILPVVIPAGYTPEEALDNTDAFKVVWEIVQALRSHDERLEGSVNSLQYDMATTSVVQVINIDKNKGKDQNSGSGAHGSAGEDGQESTAGDPGQMKMDFSDRELQEAVNAVIVKKCGNKVYWEDWAKDIGDIAKRHIERVGELVLNGGPASAEFAVFLRGLRDSLNNGITEDEAVEMLAQHMITLPVFDALFSEAEFAKSNPVSIAMESMVATLRGYGIETESEKRELAELYSSVRLRAEAIRSDAGKQKIIKELYEKFFSQAFKATSEKMGIVYTPNEVVNYILHATDRILRKEFGKCLADEGVRILDPFTGTGTFVVNLLQDEELIPTEKLPNKYANEIYCNEILLLAYYIATINIEHAYHSRIPQKYVPFEGGVLTDTFQMHEDGDTIDAMVFSENTERILRQMETPIDVIVGNPPYSAGQKNANDNNQNMSYPTLDAKIAATYAAQGSATNKNSLYDQYIRAFRWASDRIEGKGIVSFVTNGGWLDGQAMDGFRRTLVSEFNSIYVFNLRGNQRTQGEQSRKEGGKVFGSGSRTPVAITILVKNPDSAEHGVIHYHDIGDYLTREEKLSIVASAVSGEPFEWDIIKPDRHGDWLNQRDDSWYEFVPLGINKRKNPLGMFEIWSAGLKTQRDPWAWGYDGAAVAERMQKLVFDMNQEIAAAKAESHDIEYDSKRFSWTRRMEDYAKKGQAIELGEFAVVEGMYRPFCKQWVYYNKIMNERTYQQPRLFPLASSEGKKAERTYQQPNIFPVQKEKGGVEMTYQQESLHCLDNLVITMTGGRAFSVLVSDFLPDLHFCGDSQCFPLYWYEERESLGGLLSKGDIKKGEYVRHDAITDETLGVFRAAYPNAFGSGKGRTIEQAKADGLPSKIANSNERFDVNKVDIFYYVYGILHSPEYRSRFEANLKKELPRIPLSRNFHAFCGAGRALAKLHLGYEEVEPWPVKEVGSSLLPGPVKKIKWGKRKDPETGKKVDDHTVLVYNENLLIKGIPEAAQRYTVNGRSPLEWVIDRYQVKIDKASGIVNDPNEYSDDPRYIVDLIEKLIRVSMETMEIVDQLPPVSELPQPANWPFAWKAGE